MGLGFAHENAIRVFTHGNAVEHWRMMMLAQPRQQNLSLLSLAKPKQKKLAWWCDFLSCYLLLTYSKLVWFESFKNLLYFIIKIKIDKHGHSPVHDIIVVVPVARLPPSFQEFIIMLMPSNPSSTYANIESLYDKRYRARLAIF
jgi:hypothetical protein